MAIASYSPSAFESVLGYVVIIAVLTIIIVFHVLLIKNKILTRQKTRIKSFIIMIISSSIFWGIGGFLLFMGVFSFAYYGFPIENTEGLGMMFLTSSSFFLLTGTLIFCFGTLFGVLVASTIFRETKNE
jgi:hypothetical protein